MRTLTKGFTLIELMIVVAIIGILAAIAIPNFVKFQCRSKQSEAKGNLKSLYVSQEAYRAENDSYAPVTAVSQGNASTVTNSIGFSLKGAKIRYIYQTTSASTTNFIANATGVNDVATDLWTISHQNDITNNTNVCQ